MLHVPGGCAAIGRSVGHEGSWNHVTGASIHALARATRARTVERQAGADDATTASLEQRALRRNDIN